jgi:hypothetical protein
LEEAWRHGEIVADADGVEESTTAAPMSRFDVVAPDIQ